LETLSKKPYFSASDAYELGSSKESKRQEIAESLLCEVSSVPPSRLLALLGQAMRHQHSQGLLTPGTPFDLFRGARKAARKDVEEKIPKKAAGSVVLSKESQAEAVVFSPDGQSLVTGSLDGFVELWDLDTCKLRADLDYQAAGQFMMQEGAISCGSFSKDGEHMVTGSQKGVIKVWKLSSGLCLRNFAQAHTQGITSVSFAKDATQVLSTSYDQTARIHGLKSGKTLKEFRSCLLTFLTFRFNLIFYQLEVTHHL
jgi:WD40 repeat-containing protein SMU1